MLEKNIKKYVTLLCCLLLVNILLFSKAQAQTDTIVVINTDFGVMKVKLYNDTPIHKRNFLKLVSQGFYDSLLFHRIISGFMIQGGDPDSKYATSEQTLGNGDIGYTLPAEISNVHFHKKGAIAAARQSDDVNPEKKSSGCQFYIVHGKKFSELDMNTVESRMASQLKQSLILKYLGRPENAALKERFLYHQKSRNLDSLNYINRQIQPFIDEELKSINPHKFTAEQKQIYSINGGTPHLDGNYTVFGEVIEGLEIIDKIAQVEVAGNSRPVSNVVMKLNLEPVKK